MSYQKKVYLKNIYFLFCASWCAISFSMQEKDIVALGRNEFDSCVVKWCTDSIINEFTESSLYSFSPKKKEFLGIIDKKKKHFMDSFRALFSTENQVFQAPVAAKSECIRFVERMRTEFFERLKNIYNITLNIEELGNSVKIAVRPGEETEDYRQKIRLIDENVKRLYKDPRSELENVDQLFGLDFGFYDCSYPESIFFEDTFSQCFLHYFNADENDVVYAGLGSGGLEPDSRFLIRLLSEGIPITDVHLIDPKYCVSILMLRGSTDLLAKYLVTRIQFFREQEFCQMLKARQERSNEFRPWPQTGEQSVKGCAYRVLDNCISESMRFAKFTYLLSLLAKRGINVYLHYSIDSYLSVLQEWNLKPANMAMALFTPFDPPTTGEVFDLNELENVSENGKEFSRFLRSGIIDNGFFGCCNTNGSMIQVIRSEEI